MLISDWSSDVCSSDLSVTFVTFRRVGTRTAIRRAPIEPGREQANRRARSRVLRRVYRDAIIVRLLTDRKSVVLGKSVSVRVDAGGRRIITKKTTRESTTVTISETK